MALVFVIILLRIAAVALIGGCLLIGARLFVLMIQEYREGNYDHTVLGFLIGYGISLTFGVWVLIQVLP